MKRLIAGLVILLFLIFGWVFLEIYLKYGNKPVYVNEGKVSVLDYSGEVTTQAKKGGLLVKTARGRALVSAGGGLFLLRENSSAEFSLSGIKLISGVAEFYGEGMLKNPALSCNFNGEGVLSERTVSVLRGKACGASSGEIFSGKGKRKISIPDLSVKAARDGLLVKVSSPSLVEISREPFFVRPISSFNISSSRLIRTGNGSFHLRACLPSGLICGPSHPVIFKDLRAQLRSIDKTPPQLDVSITPKGKVVIIRGTTEVGVKVFVNGARVPVEASGKFFHTLEFNTPGIKTVVVEAMDSAGNVSRKVKQVVVYGD